MSEFQLIVIANDVQPIVGFLVLPLVTAALGVILLLLGIRFGLFKMEDLTNKPAFKEDEPVDFVDRSDDHLKEDTQKLKVMQVWFEDFTELAEWMRIQDMWDAEDIDTEHPMKTYRKGLERFLTEHNIPIKKS